MARWNRRAQRRVDHAVAQMRAGYDTALTDGGVVLFQQVAPGVDGHYVSLSMTATLGWEASAFRVAGTLRRLIHPDDLAAFRGIVPTGPLIPPLPEAEPAVPTGHFDVMVPDLTIDLTAAAGPSGVAVRTNDGSAIELATGAFTAPPAPKQAPVATEPIIRFLTADGDYREMLVRLAPIGPGDPVRGALVDVSVSQQARIDERRFAEMVDKATHGHLVLELVDQDDPGSLVVRSANRAARRTFNLERAGVDGTPIDAVLGESSAQLFRSALFDVAHTGESLSAERLTFVEVPGTYMDLRVDRLVDGTLGVTIEDVTRSVAVEERLRHQASHDHLTGLPNRAMLDERLAVVTASLPADQFVALMLVDVDGLREINHRYGHHVGDQLLVELGRRLVGEIPGCEMVARIGGDEFAVLTLPHAVPDDALGRAAAVQDALDRAVDLDGDAQALRCTIGVALAPEHGQDPRTLMRSADSALQQARADADRLAVYDPIEERTSIRRLGLLTQLRQGLANQELELRYQPLVELRTGRVTKVEALLRWQRQDGGARMPVEFLELAEQSGLIQPLTRWILGEAARTAQRLGRDGERTVVSANLSLRNLYDTELLTFLDLLAASGELEPDLVEIEISETELMDDPIRAQDVISHLAGLGLRVIVDDFGTGYTSMSTMSGLAVSGLKIDRGFITTLSSVPADATVVQSTIDLAHDLELSVTAEGVADAATLALLTEMGCDHAQGFHLSEPVSLDTLPGRVTELEEALRGWVGTPVASES